MQSKNILQRFVAIVFVFLIGSGFFVVNDGWPRFDLVSQLDGQRGASPTGRRKRTWINRLRPRGRKVRLEPGPGARRIVAGVSAETQMLPKFASSLHIRGR
jgi:hypothetical protein